MRMLYCAVIVGVVLIGVVGCGAPAKDAKTSDRIEGKTDNRPVPPANPPFPKAVVENYEYDFGVMEAQTVGKHSFVIRNDGDFPLELVKGPTTCKCTINSLSNKTLQKGESVSIDLEWTPPGQTPAFSQSAEIFTNDPEQTSIKLMVKGRVEKIADVVPSERWTIGQIEGNKDETVTGFVKSALLDKFEINGIHSTEDDIEATHRPMTKQELKDYKAKSGYSITAKLLRRNVVGSFSKRLTIKTSVNEKEGRQGETYVVDVVGTRIGPILIRSIARPGEEVAWSSEKMQLAIKPFDGQKGKTVSLMLFASGLKAGEELTIKKVSSDPENIQVRIEPEPLPDLNNGKKTASLRKAYRLFFIFPPKTAPVSRTSNRPAKVKISTSHPGVKEMTFSLIYRVN